MKKVLVLCLIVLSSNCFSNKIESCFPNVGIEIPINKNNSKLFFNKASGLTQNEYLVVLREFENVWMSIIEKKYNKKLIIKEAWGENRVNAHATRDDDNNPVIVFNGGLARHEQMTKEGMLLILCHELGHHYGGAPKAFRGNSERRSWSSAEGQADYFATNKCMNKFLSSHLSVSFEFGSVPNGCETELCQKIVPAALSVGNLFASLKRQWKKPSIKAKDKNKVDITEYKHPNPQCRVDTFLAGSLCEREFGVDFDNKDYRVGACLIEEFPAGARPGCWFSSESY
ncbi:MAG: hypothetical protein ACJAS4_001145 [Bacteriovoracaceae bacterium]|jgi:hypothetical protein